VEVSRSWLDCALAAYASSIEAALPGGIRAVYVVGSLALDDFSQRQSNVDLVVVTDAPLADLDPSAETRRRVSAAERHLLHAGRNPSVWYATWDKVAAAPDPLSRDPVRDRGSIDTPMTRALLREDAIAITGPDWPVVWFDEAELKQWCNTRFRNLVEGDKGMVIFRRVISPMVLEAARLAHGCLTGKVLSKSAAGEAVRSLLPAHFRRILTDSIGYRNGAHASMYWGPYERKYDAQRLLMRLGEALDAA
jgi:hypothetical protein